MLYIHFIPSLSTGGAELSLLQLLRIRSQLTDNLHHQKECICVFKIPKPHIKQLSPPDNISIFNIFKLKDFSNFLFFLLRHLFTSKQKINFVGWMYNGNVVSSLFYLLLPINSSLIWNFRHSLNAGKSNLSFSSQVCLSILQLFQNLPRKLNFNSVNSLNSHKSFFNSTRNFQLSLNPALPPLSAYPKSFDQQSIEKEIYCIDPHRDKYVIGFLGRNHYHKNVRLLLDTALKLIKSSPSERSPFLFLFVGRGFVLDNYFVKAKKDFPDNFLLMNEISDPQSFYNTIDVYWQSSITESWPNSLYHSAINSIPSISSNVGDASSFIFPPSIILNKSDVSAFSSALLSLVSNLPPQKDLYQNYLILLELYTVYKFLDSHA